MNVLGRASGTAPWEGDLRVGPVVSIPALLREFGHDPNPILKRVGIHRNLLAKVENRISFGALGRLLDECVRATGCAHFGLLVGERFDVATLGEIAYLMRNAPTVEAALGSFVLHQHLNDSGAVPMLLGSGPNRVALGYSVYRHEVSAIDQIYDAAAMIGVHLLRALCGPSWQPIKVAFAHRLPADLAPYRRCFGSNLSFDAELTAVTFSASWLKQRIPGADSVLREILEGTMRQQERENGMRLTERVRRALRPMVFTGIASTETVARLFSLHERALRRHLRAEGTTLNELLNEARFEIARQLVRDTRLKLSDVASALHYSDATAFSRAFRSWSGMAPAQWRARANRERGS